MAWVGIKDDGWRHILDSFRGDSPYISLCGIELDPNGNAPWDDARQCLPCRKRWDERHPPRVVTERGGVKLPRCECPTCGSTHIKGRNT